MISPNRFHHDKLNVKDIQGTQSDVYGKYKLIEGRDGMDQSDIERSRPNQLKQNRITNIPDYKISVKDIDSPGANKFKSTRITDPMNPVYKMETQSRRHVIEMGKIDGNAPKITRSPVTRRFVNDVSDIEGSRPRERGSIPAEMLLQQRSL